MSAHTFALFVKEQFSPSQQKQTQKNKGTQALTQKETPQQINREQDLESKKHDTKTLFQQELIIQDNATVHRMLHVLRLTKDDPIIVFNHDYNATGIVQEINKKSCTIALHTITKNIPITPTIHWFLPILDRTDFEQAIYHLTVLGISSITPYISKKTRHNWGSEKDFERIQHIMVAAAEQSKQFCLPTINKPETLEKIVLNEMVNYHTILLDVEATQDLITTLTKHVSQSNTLSTGYTLNKTQSSNSPVKHLAFIAGPEGDLTIEEYALIKPAMYAHCKLSNTILKACDAIFLASGIARTIYQ